MSRVCRLHMSRVARLLVLAVLFSGADTGLGDLDIREIRLSAREDGTLSALLIEDTVRDFASHL